MAQYFANKGLGFVRLTHPPLNSLSLAVRDGIMKSLDSAVKDKVDAVVLLGDGKAFCAGADISEFAKGGHMTNPSLATVLERLDSFELPTVAHVNGIALGGGLETALSCHWRYASPRAAVGLPEVHLGILPGAGGTQRLPRLCGAAKALEIMTSGRTLSANEALQLNIVDGIASQHFNTEDEMIHGMHSYIHDNNLLDHSLADRRIALRGVPGDSSPDMLKALEAQVLKSSRGFAAPLNIFKAVEAAATYGVGEEAFAKGMKREGELFNELAKGPQAKAMQYFFFSERKVNSPPKNTDGSVIKSPPLGTVGIVGGGTMGAGIAMCFCNAGVPVTLVESSPEAATAAVDRITNTYKSSSAFKSGKLTDAAVSKLMAYITPMTSLESLNDADLVIEAVYENMDVKKNIFGKLDKICKPGALLATNTSCLDIDEIANCTSRPESVIGTHFFSPANVMKLLEVVRGSKTSTETIAACMNMGKKINKVSAVAGNCYGFIGNRMLEPYARECMALMEEGCTPLQVDTVLKRDMGLAMGLFEMSDLAGNDVSWRLRQERGLTGDHKGISHLPNAPDYPNMQYCSIPDTLCEQGHYGQKVGRGWYHYDPSAPRKPVESADTLSLIDTHRKEKGIVPRTITDDEIKDRSMLALVNEGYRILEEGMANGPEDLDVVYIYGYGFPRYRGGPLFWAENEVGLATVLATLEKYHAKYPTQQWLKPASLLVNAVNSKCSIKKELSKLRG